MLRVDDSDLSRLMYSSRWRKSNDSQLDNSSGHSSVQPGSFVTFQFNGTYVEVHGAALPGASGANPKTKLSFTLDFNTTSFYSPQFNTADPEPMYNQTIFISSTLPDAQHTLNIIYANTDNPPVVWLDFIDFIPSSASTSTSTPPTTPPTSNAPTPTRSNLNALLSGAVAGIAVAAAVVVVLLVIGFWLWRHRQVKEANRRMTELATTPYMADRSQPEHSLFTSMREASTSHVAGQSGDFSSWTTFLSSFSHKGSQSQPSLSLHGHPGPPPSYQP
ncbi:hypothetical protein L218DRAFT_1081841 [Marasmius fiardii PR-910]|nr:hypothetical protein L218DRAFT_1081841 [Marasmius fiardii PR-910]